MIFNNTNLTGLRPTTRITLRKNPRGPLIRFSFQGGDGLASNAPGCASSPLHPCRITTASPDCGSSPVLPSRAAPWQDSIPAHLLTGTSGISSRWPCFHVALTFKPGVMAMESKPAFQPAALRCGSRQVVLTRRPHCRASPIKGTRLPRSDSAGKQSLRAIRLGRRGVRGLAAPSTVQ